MLTYTWALQLSHNMFNFILILSIISFASIFGSRINDGHDTKIVGGYPVKISDRPFQATTFPSGCGAIIISATKVLTAAHCYSGIQQTQLRVGSEQFTGSGLIVNSSKMVIHPKYDFIKIDYDVAVITLDEPLQFNENVQAIELLDAEPEGGGVAIASGWGDTEPLGPYPGVCSSESTFSKFRDNKGSDILLAVELNIVERSKCVKQYENCIIHPTARMICAGVPEGGKSTCHGDSGGPLTVDGKLAGIVSWSNGCAYKDFSGVFTNVVDSEIRQFISEQLLN